MSSSLEKKIEQENCKTTRNILDPCAFDYVRLHSIIFDYIQLYRTCDFDEMLKQHASPHFCDYAISIFC